MAEAFIKRENTKRVNEGKPLLPQPKRRARTGMKKDKFADTASAKKYNNQATASAASGELGDDRPPAKRQKIDDAANTLDELLASIRPSLTSDGESMETHHSDDSGIDTGDVSRYTIYQTV